MLADTLRELVAIPSVSGQEQQLATYLAERCNAPRRTVTLLGDNVAVHIPGIDSTKAFLANGHIDTVPPTTQWTEDPFVLRQDPADADKLIALGTSDMKSGLALIVDLSDEVTERRPPCDMWLLFSSNEETDSSGSIYMAEWLSEEIRHRYRVIGGLILEPTDAAFVGVGHRGDTLWNIDARGPGGHASQIFDAEMPSIEKIARLLAALPVLRQEWAAKYSDPLLGIPSVNATIISGGATRNVVPVAASTALNLRVTKQLAADLSKIRAELEAQYEVSIKQAWEPEASVCAPDEQIYKAAQAAMPNVPFSAFPGATDQFAFHAHGIPMLIYGPGAVAAMHKPDEWVRYSAMQACRQIVGRILARFSVD